jgi:hypothetical protein
MRPWRSLYEILQVDRMAEPEVVEAAFRRLARKYHPDVSGSADGAHRMKELIAAYETLRDPARRAAYDLELRSDGPGPVDGRHRRAEPEPQTWLACRQHPMSAAVGACASCGGGLCELCFDRYRPARCSACVESWASRGRHRLLLPALWFFILLGAMAYLVANSASLVVHPRP